MRRTSKGRVVYNRKVHFFGPKDVERILDRVDWNGIPTEVRFEALLQIGLKVLGWLDSTAGEALDEEIRSAAGTVGLLEEELISFLTRFANRMGSSLGKYFGITFK